MLQFNISRKSIVWPFVSIFIFCNAVAQEEQNIWYFGEKAGIDFSQEPPVALTNSQMDAHEGSAVMSDGNGNLLFYTNGGPHNPLSYVGGVWNKNHQLMPNGDLSGSSSCNSAAQSALIVPDPNPSNNEYYIFTVDCQENGLSGGLRYNKVDLDLDNGLGDVTQKNTLVQGNLTEGMIGIKHNNNTDYWVIVSERNTNNLFAFLVTSTGINPVVTTAIGNNTYSVAGEMSSSPDGTWVGLSATWNTYLYNFNRSTGQFSNFIALDVESYGCAFSPNSQVFYATEHYGDQKIRQYDLTAADIPNSVIEVATTGTRSGPMQLAPNGKIYVTNLYASRLGVINNPNTLGTGCSYQSNGIDLNGRNGKLNLPNFVNNLHQPLSISSFANSLPAQIAQNPVQKELTIILDPKYSGKEMTAMLFNTLGQEVLKKKLYTGTTTTLEMPIPSGVYFLNLQIDQQSYSTKIIKD